MKIHSYTLITLLFVLTIGVSHAQTNLNLGIEKQFMFSENAAFLLDFNTGEVVLTIPLKEKPLFATLNEVQQVIYLMSAHYIFKVDANSGNKIDEFMFAEILEEWPNETKDPNEDCHQKGITKNGLALFEYNKERRKVLYDDPYAVNMTTETARTISKKTYFTANIETKSISPYSLDLSTEFLYKGKHKVYLSLPSTSTMNVDGVIKLSTLYIDGISGTGKQGGMIDYHIITKRIDENSFKSYDYDFSLFEDYLSGTKIYETPIELSETTILIPFTFIVSPNSKLEYSFIFCKKNSSKVLDIKNAQNFVPIKQFNSTKPWSATKEVTGNQPLFHPPEVYSEYLKSSSPKPEFLPHTAYEKTLKWMYIAKKSNQANSLFVNYVKNKLSKESRSSRKKRFNEIFHEMNDYCVKLKAWYRHDHQYLFNIKLVNDNTPNNIVVEHKTSIAKNSSGLVNHHAKYGGTVYKDKYYLVENYIGSKMSGYTMYDLTTGDIVYTIDLDF